MNDERFLVRWSRRKALARSSSAPATATEEADAGEAAPAQRVAPVPANVVIDESEPRTGAPAPDSSGNDEAPLLTLADVERLTRDSDFAPFVARSVEPQVKNAALKKLFSDPHFNAMDGLDVYIADYNAPDPLPQGSLLALAQAQFLGLAKAEAQQLLALDSDATVAAHMPGAGAAVAPPTARTGSAPDEDSDLQLQPDDAAGRACTEPGPREDGGHEH